MFKTIIFIYTFVQHLSCVVFLPVASHDKQQCEDWRSKSKDNEVAERKHVDSHIAEQDGDSDGKVADCQTDPGA